MSVSCFCKFSELKSRWTDGFLKDLYQKTTFALKMWSKTHIWTNLRILCEIDQKVSIFVEKLQKMQTPKMTFRSQIEPSIKSYECFMFLQNFRLEITLDRWVLERPFVFFFRKPRKSKNALYYEKNQTRKLFGDFEVGVLLRVTLNLARPSRWF